MSGENPLHWLGLIPKKSNIGKENEMIYNPPWKVSRKEVQRIGRKRKIIGNKVTQRESQKVKQISIILKTIDEFGPINTSEIKNKSGLSSNSVSRTLKLLNMKKIVKQKQPNQKTNNEKIYSLHKDNAIIYHENLLFHKMQVSEKSPKKKMKSDLEKWDYIKKGLPNGWEEWTLKTKHGEKRVSLLPKMKLIMFNYARGMYCKNCFEKGIVKKWKQKHGTSFCDNCWETDTDEDNFFRKRSNTKSRKGMVNEEISKIEKKYQEHSESNA